MPPPSPVAVGQSPQALVGKSATGHPIDRADARSAVRAWVALGHIELPPSRVQFLRRRNKSVAFRLAGVGREGGDVVAKRCCIETARVERAVYRTLSGSVSQLLDYYGFVRDVAGEFAWVFVEDAGGKPYDPNDVAQRHAVARWLAEFHTATVGADLQVPDRKAAFYFEYLTMARTTALQHTEGLALAARERRILANISRMCDAVESRWPGVEQACDLYPRVLVHNDFTGRNVRIRGDGPAPAVLAFDWELAGWGLPPIDVLETDRDEYWLHVRRHWKSIDRGSFERTFWIAMLLRNLAAIHWESLMISAEYWEGPIRNVDRYLKSMTHARCQLAW